MLKAIKTLFIATGFFSLVLLVWANRTGKFAVKPYDHGGQVTQVTPSTKWAPGVIPVRVGIFLENAYDFSIDTQSLAAEGVVWVTWPQEFQDLLDAQGLEIEQVINPVNRVNSWDNILKPFYAEPIRLPSGEFHQILRFANRFYASAVDLHRYPFERLSFPVIFGLNVMSESFGAQKVRLIADTQQSGVGPYIDIIGFVTDRMTVSELIQRYPTAFGHGKAGEPTSSEFSQIRLAVEYRKSGFASAQQLILPLLIVMLMVLFAPILAASLWDVRIAIPSTALLTLVFLQQGYRQGLPLLPYVTFLDQIYAECYLVTFALFALFVWASNKLDSAAEGERPAVIARLNKIDHRVQWVLIAFLVISTTLNYLFPLRY